MEKYRFIRPRRRVGETVRYYVHLIKSTHSILLNVIYVSQDKHLNKLQKEVN